MRAGPRRASGRSSKFSPGSGSGSGARRLGSADPTEPRRRFARCARCPSRACESRASAPAPWTSSSEAPTPPVVSPPPSPRAAPDAPGAPATYPRRRIRRCQPQTPLHPRAKRPRRCARAARAPPPYPVSSSASRRVPRLATLSAWRGAVAGRPRVSPSPPRTCRRGNLQTGSATARLPPPPHRRMTWTGTTWTGATRWTPRGWRTR
mmetsp:Transcript_3867/g.15737  ORF Transcript_3867/g.15737 Transcript_3867/m.15737 type:complete len:207 (+) Transcript_3867:1236-1856(+)